MKNILVAFEFMSEGFNEFDITALRKAIDDLVRDDPRFDGIYGVSQFVADVREIE